MEYKNEQHSCIDCIWHDQCESDEVCDLFDPGRLPTDEEIELQIEIGREQYRSEFHQYVKEYEDGQCDQ